MMPHLGVLASVHPQAAMEVFERDCLVRLGWCVAAHGEARWGKPCFRFSVTGAAQQTGHLACGDVALVRVPAGGEVEVTVEPEKGFDFGAGSGKPMTRRVRGGAIGIFFDARGRALILPRNAAERRLAVGSWARSWETID